MIPSIGFFNNNPSRQVNFGTSSGHSIETLTSDVQEKDVCVYWYIGAHGFKQGAIDFYRTALTQNITQGATPFVVDLTAWGAFDKKCPLSRYHESAVSLDGDKLKVLRCSDFFEALQQVKPGDKVYPLIQDILGREELLAPSATFDSKGFTLGELFNNNCPAIEKIYHLDCGKSYSVIQYLEFLFLIEKILLKQQDARSIKFILPNDEAKYYFSTMAKDLQTFLAARGLKAHDLNIQIQCFNYGEQLSHRPYNCPSKTIPGKKKISLSQIINDQGLNMKPTFKS